MDTTLPKIKFGRFNAPWMLAFVTLSLFLKSAHAADECYQTYLKASRVDAVAASFGNEMLLGPLLMESGYAHLLLTAIDEARVDQPGKHTLALAQIFDATIYGTWIQRSLHPSFRISSPRRREWQSRLAGRRLTPTDILRANQTLDARGALCTSNGHMLNPTQYVQAIMSTQGAAF